jgi:hypothetical protein
MERMNEPGKVEVHNEKAWELYLEAEKRELGLRFLSPVAGPSASRFGPLRWLCRGR